MTVDRVHAGSLEPHEHDFQNLKDQAPANTRNTFSFMYDLSKQASAFGNGSGGILIIGVNDAGEVDGGVSKNLKSGTRAARGSARCMCRPAIARVQCIRSDWASLQPDSTRPGSVCH